MGHQPTKSMEDNLRIVLAVLRGEITIAEAARREGTSAVSISKWRDQFLAGGQQALETSSRVGPSSLLQGLRGPRRQAPYATGLLRGCRGYLWRVDPEVQVARVGRLE